MLAATFCGGIAGGIEDFEIELLVELGQFALSSDGEEFPGHVGEGAIVAHGMVGEGGDELVGHEMRLAGAAREMLQAI